jgi:hypothetical protein
LALGVVEVGGYGDDGFADGSAEVGFGSEAELFEDVGADLLGGEDVGTDLDAGGVVVARDDGVGEVGEFGLGVCDAAAHESFDAEDGLLGEFDGVVACFVADGEELGGVGVVAEDAGE